MIFDWKVGIALFVLALCYVLAKIIAHAIRFLKITAVLEKFPHDKKHWLYGNIHQHPGFNVRGLEYLRKRVERFPKCCSFWAGSYIRGDLYLHHPEPLSILLKTAEPKPVISGIYRYFIPWLGNGLILSSGSHWFRNRRLLTNVFHFEILKHYMVVKNRCVDIFLKNLEPYALSGESFDIFRKLSFLAMDIMLRCTVSLETKVQEREQEHPYLKAIKTLARLWTKRILKPLHHYDFIYRFTKNGKEFLQCCDYVHKTSGDIIQIRKQSSKLSLEKSQKDFLDVLLTAKDEDGNGLTDLEIRDEVDNFLFAGHDTTTSSNSWILYSLAEHPEIQERCHKEIDEIFEGRIDDELKWEDLQKLNYLTMCIKETMRFHCPSYLVARELENPLVIDGIKLLPGTLLYIDIYSLHHNPAVWPDPMKFDPDRFTPENVVKRDNFAFLPFSAGPRNCIGQNFALEGLKLVVARTLRKFNVRLDPNRKTIPKPAAVMKTENGMFMKLSKRF